MKSSSMNGVATWGGVEAGEALLVARLADQNHDLSESGGKVPSLSHFECQITAIGAGTSLSSDTTAEVSHAAGDHSPDAKTAKTSHSASQKSCLIGLSATHMALRRMEVPFQRSDQIRAILPQESADMLLERLQQPSFAFHAEANDHGEGSQVCFAVCENHLLSNFSKRLAAIGVRPIGVVLAELGAWPLLQRAGLLLDRGLIVDATLDPPAIIHVEEGRLKALRLVAPATVAAGDEAVQEELQWLLTALWSQVQANQKQTKPLVNPLALTLEKSPENSLENSPDRSKNHTTPTSHGVGEIIFLGKAQPFWTPFLQQPPWFQTSTGETPPNCVLPWSMRIPELAQLGSGLGEWKWVRAAGLALAAHQGHKRLLDFYGGGSFQSLIREWLAFWRFAGLLCLLLAMVWGGMEGVRYYKAQTKQQHFKGEITRLFKKALPRVPVMLDPRLQLRQALNQTAPEGTKALKMVAWLRLIQTKVEAESKVKWLRFRYEPGEVQLLGEVPSYEHLDRVQKALKSISAVHEVRTEEARIITKTKKVQFRLRLL